MIKRENYSDDLTEALSQKVDEQIIEIEELKDKLKESEEMVKLWREQAESLARKLGI